MNNKVTFKDAMIAWGFAAAVSSIINITLFFVAHAVGFITDNIFIQPDTPLKFYNMIFASVIPSFFAMLVFYLIDKYSKKGFKVFAIVSTVLLVLSMGNPFMIKGVTVPYALSLDIMHVVVAAAVLFFAYRAKQKLA
jgi:hypothetical protein